MTPKQGERQQETVEDHMFIDFAGHVSSYELTIKGAGPASTPEARIHLKLTLNEQTIKRLGFDNGDDIRKAEPVMEIRSGEPVYANGERIEGGCGALWYIPAFDGNPTFLEGLAYLPEREFERVWRMLSLPTVLRMMVNAQIGDLPFSAREERLIWATAGQESTMLLIRDVTISFGSNFPKADVI